MEPTIRCIPFINNVGLQKAEANVPEMEGFGFSIDELFSKVNELEQGVDIVEQFYTTADNRQLNNAKCSSIVKDKFNEKYLMITEKQKRHASNIEAAAARRMQELMHQFAEMFFEITQHGWAWPFMQPVDVVGLGLHDYYEVIEKPMDLGTIKNKMEAKDGTGYRNVREIYADVRLVFKNAMKYNDERDDVFEMASILLSKFEEKWLQLLPKVDEEEDRHAKDKVAVKEAAKLAQEASVAKMARHLSNELREVDVQLGQLKKLVVQECRKTTIEEKKELTAALTRLSPEDLNRALEIVADDNPSFQATTQEVVLDMDTQSELTLWRLRVFVKDALGVMGRNCTDTDAKNTNICTKKSKNATPSVTTNKRRRGICNAINRTHCKKTKKISRIS